jgi:hypothetical protein
VHRLQQLASAFGDMQKTQAFTWATSLSYAGQKRLDSGEVSTNAWNNNVADIFDSSALTTEQGVSTTIGVPTSAEFAIGNNQKAQCAFVFSTVQLSIPYTATAVFLFDAEGTTSWATSFAAQYEVRT